MADNNVIPLFGRERSLGTFHAVGCRDTSSLERDGEPYFELNTLDTTDGRPLVEIRFADGVWLLADPTLDLVPRQDPSAAT